MRPLFCIALWGEPPETAKQTCADWESYISDFRQDHSAAETAAATVSATMSHIRWRATSSTANTTVPITIAAVAVAVASVICGLLESATTNFWSDIHIALAMLMFMAALVQQPWKIEHSRLLSISMIAVATAALHGALTFELMPIQQEMVVAGHLIISAGMFSGGVSGLMTKTAFGSRGVHLGLLAVGLAVVICANILGIRDAGSAAVALTLLFLSMAEVAALSQLSKIWAMSVKPTSFGHAIPST